MSKPCSRRDNLSLFKEAPTIINSMSSYRVKASLTILGIFLGERKYLPTRAYFSVQYCTLCAVLIKKCAVLNMKLCSIEIWNVLSSTKKAIWKLFNSAKQHLGQWAIDFTKNIISKFTKRAKDLSAQHKLFPKSVFP